MARAICILAGLLAASCAFADCAPPGLVRIVTKNASPGIAADSFQAQPKIQYRLGNGRSRLEEKPDPQSGVHLRFVRATSGYQDRPLALTADDDESVLARRGSSARLGRTDALLLAD